MWKLYVAAGQGVAIRSTIDRLIRAFPEGRDSHMRAEPLPPMPRADTSNRDSRGVSNVLAVHFGPVVYADYADTSTVGTRAMGPRSAYFLKRKSFEHEREFRVLLWALAVDADGHVDLNVPVFPDGGVAVPVNLDVLIEAIHVSPGAPQWFREAVEASVHRFDRRFPVIQSNLDVDPIY